MTDPEVRPSVEPMISPSPHTVSIPGPPKSEDLSASHIVITKTTSPRSVPEPNSKEYGPLTMMPTASCLHYATQCFEGMKVYRGFDGKLRLFRPDRNCNRLVMSAQRVVLPFFDPKELEKLLLAFMAVDGPRWLPKSRPGTFLYVRPAIIGDGEELGVTSPSEALLFVIAIPWPDLSGTPPGAAPKPPGLRLLASKEDTRAWPGGFGYAKVGANYGPAFVSHIEVPPEMEIVSYLRMQGRKLGYDQILWLFGPEYQVTEAGASNFFLILRNPETKTQQLITAPLTGKIILDGVTRRSVLDLAHERLTPTAKSTSKFLPPDMEPLEIVERTYTMLEVEEAQKEGRIVEAFVSGTAYFITPVSAISFRDRDIPIPMQAGESGVYTKMIKTWLYDIMYGNVQHEWGVVVDEEESKLQCLAS
ncbi:hypothetical protein NHQ30_000304 [Ciborinia camelliae]|nr:hypothetical protein NHQ30_000304 [Ciborinia camelliae]